MADYSMICGHGVDLNGNYCGPCAIEERRRKTNPTLEEQITSTQFRLRLAISRRDLAQQDVDKYEQDLDKLNNITNIQLEKTKIKEV